MKTIQPLRDIGTPLADISGPIPFVGVQAAFDEFFQRGTLRSYWKSTYVEELTDPILDPESLYVEPARWARTGSPSRKRTRSAASSRADA